MPLIVAAGDRKGRLWIDFMVTVDDRAVMVIKYAPGSLVTRHRSSLAIARVAASHQIPVVVVTNGEAADILDGETGRLLASGFDNIPSRAELTEKIQYAVFAPISPKRVEMESRILYAYEIDGGCPCDDSTCRIA